MSIDFDRLSKGGAAIEQRVKDAKKGGGSFRNFAPQIFWKDDGDERYVLFLTPLDEVVDLDMILMIPVSGKKGNGDTYTYFEQVMARTDQLLGEAVDPMAEEWAGKVRATNLAVAVELEPLVEIMPNGRKRPNGFEVKTVTFDRRIRNAAGELTDESEEVTAPAIGFVTQSPSNFGNLLRSFDANEGPIDEIAMKITRIGKDKNTSYNVQGYLGQDIDLSNLLECVDGISYLGDEVDDVIDEIANIEDDREAMNYLGIVLRNKRIEELADEARYQTIFDGITKTLDPWAKDKKGGKEEKAERPTRPSQRRSRRTPEPAGEADVEPEPDATPEPDESSAPTGRRTRRVTKAEAEPAAEEAPGATQRRNISELRKRAGEKAKKATA